MLIKALILVVGSTGVGKTTLQEGLIKNLGFHRLVTTTTRYPRSNERNGVDYHFESLTTFLSSKDQYLFQDQIFDNWYGLSYRALEVAAQSQKPTVLVAKIHDIEIFKPFCEQIVVVELVAQDVKALSKNRESASTRMLERLEMESSEQFQNDDEVLLRLEVDSLNREQVFHWVTNELTRRNIL